MSDTAHTPEGDPSIDSATPAADATVEAQQDLDRPPGAEDSSVDPGAALEKKEAPPGPLRLPGPAMKVPPLITVWVALSVGFVGVVSLAGSGGGMVAAISAVAMVGIFGLQARVVGIRRQAHQTLQRGHQAFSAGNFEVANAELGALVRSNGPPELRAQATYFWGITAMRRGEHHEAKERFAAVVDGGWDKRQSGLANIAPEVHAFLIIACALDGDLDEAQRRLAAGRKRFEGAPIWFVAQAFVLARSEQWRPLIDLLERSGTAIEDKIVGTLMRQLDLLRALALAQLAGDRYRVADESEHLASVLRGMKYGRFDYLASTWPAMREFLRSHSMLRAPSLSD